MANNKKLILTHAQAVKHVTRMVTKFEGVKPQYYNLLSEYLKVTKQPGQRGAVLKLMGNAEQEEIRKELGRAFTLTEAEYLDIYRFNPQNENTLVDFLNGVFVCDYLNNKEVSYRYHELEDIVSQFKEISTNLFMYENNRAIKFVLGVSGRCYEYVKGANYLKTEVSENEVKMTYKDGREEVIFDGQAFSTNFKDGFCRLDKGYLRFSAGKEIYFRAHVLITALVYGVDILKFTLGRNSLLTIDHIDGDETNNKLSNLRLVTRKDNRILAGGKQYRVLDFLTLPMTSIKRVKSFTGIYADSVDIAQEYNWEGLSC